MEIKKFVQLIVLLAFSHQLLAQKEAYQKEMYLKGVDTLNYRIMYPKDFSVEKEYPVVFFLHGAGERGSDNEKQLVHGSTLFLKEENLNKFPAIIVFPQCPTEDYWSNAKVNRKKRPVSFKYKNRKKPTEALGLVMDLVDETIEKPYVKKDQVYVMGLSMGGMGTFEMLYRKPNIFAAAIPICGGGDPKGTKEYAAKVPLWIFHGAKDDVVSPHLSIKMADKIIENGGHPNLTIYSDANHNSWDAAFAETELLTWLFSNKLKQ